MPVLSTRFRVRTLGRQRDLDRHWRVFLDVYRSLFRLDVQLH